jgi:hypothetical protein
MMKILPLFLIAFSLVPSSLASEQKNEGNLAIHATTTEYASPPAKSMVFAYGLPIVATALPVAGGMALLYGDRGITGLALLAGGIVYGPSTGQYYAESSGTAMTGVMWRAAGAAAVAYGVSINLGCPDLRRSSCTPGNRIMAVGVTVVAVSTLYSLIDTKFAVDRALPKIDPGDLLVIHDAGAHGHSMGFQYNGKLRSAELLLKEDGSVKPIRRAETLEDYFATLDFSGV